MGSQTPPACSRADPAFVTHGGDISYANGCGRGAVHQYYVDQQVWSAGAAFEPVWGNHEYGEPNSDEGMTPPPGTPRDSLLNYKGRSFITNGQAVPSDTASQIANPGCGWETRATMNTCQGNDWGWFQVGHVLFISYPEPWPGAYPCLAGCGRPAYGCAPRLIRMSTSSSATGTGPPTAAWSRTSTPTSAPRSTTWP